MKACLALLLNFVWASLGSAQNGPPAPSPTGPVTIDQVVSEAIEHNLTLLAERYNVPVAQARIVTARLRPNPVLSLGADHVPWAGTTYTVQNQAGPPEYSVRTDFLFERGGKRGSRIAVAESARTVAELQFLDTLRTVILEAQSAFIETLQAKASLALAHENQGALSNLVEINGHRVRAGDLARVELTRVQLAELQFENTVRQSELRLKTAQLHLQLAMGRPSTPVPNNLDVTGSYRRTPLTSSLHDLIGEAEQRRPDLSALRQDQARSQADIRLQLAQGKVDYTLGSEFRRQQGLAGRGSSLGLFVQTNLPIFNRNQGEIERSRQEQLQVAAKLRALVANIETEVQVAFSQYITARDAVDRIETQMLNKARDVRETTEYSYKRGEASLVEFLDAQRAYNETMQTYNDAEADLARSLYTIDSVIGKSVNR
jgi:cobalt-zinc-cadmium efflux system outer membrane protein